MSEKEKAEARAKIEGAKKAWAQRIQEARERHNRGGDRDHRDHHGKSGDHGKSHGNPATMGNRGANPATMGNLTANPKLATVIHLMAIPRSFPG
mgnify:CR=1 FL=1